MHCRYIILYLRPLHYKLYIFHLKVGPSGSRNFLAEGSQEQKMSANRILERLPRRPSGISSGGSGEISGRNNGDQNFVKLQSQLISSKLFVAMN